MEAEDVAAILRRIADEAEEISRAWSTISGWYLTVRRNSETVILSIKYRNKEAKELMQGAIEERRQLLAKRTKQLQDERYSERRIRWYGMIPFCAEAQRMKKWNHDLKECAEKQRKELKLKYEEKGEIWGIVDRIDTLSEAMTEMGTFCDLMADYFSKQADRFRNWAGNKYQRAADIGNGGHSQWSSKQCVEWIMSLNNGQFKQYEEILEAKFTKSKRPKTGANLSEINDAWLMDVCDFEEKDAVALSDKIKDLAPKRRNAYKFIKKQHQEDMDWLEGTRNSIKSVHDLLRKLQNEAAFWPVGATVSKGFKNVELCSFEQNGKALILAPEISGKRLIESKGALMQSTESLTKSTKNPTDDLIRNAEAHVEHTDKTDTPDPNTGTLNEDTKNKI